MMQKTFHMSFADVQRRVHRTMHSTKGRQPTKPITDDELAARVIRSMDCAESNGIDLARAILRKLDERRPKRTPRN